MDPPESGTQGRGTTRTAAECDDLRHALLFLCQGEGYSSFRVWISDSMEQGIVVPLSSSAGAGKLVHPLKRNAGGPGDRNGFSRIPSWRDNEASRAGIIAGNRGLWRRTIYTERVIGGVTWRLRSRLRRPERARSIAGMVFPGPDADPLVRFGMVLLKGQEFPGRVA